MVAEKHKVDAEKASGLGMLTPQAGVAALGAVLGSLSLRDPLSAVCGAAGQVYWQKLLANVKPVPHIFEHLMMQQQRMPAEPQVMAVWLYDWQLLFGLCPSISLEFFNPTVVRSGKGTLMLCQLACSCLRSAAHLTCYQGLT